MRRRECVCMCVECILVCVCTWESMYVCLCLKEYVRVYVHVCAFRELQALICSNRLSEVWTHGPSYSYNKKFCNYIRSVTIWGYIVVPQKRNFNMYRIIYNCMKTITHNIGTVPSRPSNRCKHLTKLEQQVCVYTAGMGKIRMAINQALVASCEWQRINHRREQQINTCRTNKDRGDAAPPLSASGGSRST